MSRLWDDAVALYQAAGVRDTLLELQDAHGLDVPLLLALAWLDARGVAVDDSRFERLADAVAAWQRDVVAPLRAARRALRAEAEAPGRLGLGDADRDGFKRRVQTVELAAERLQLAQLEVLTTDWPAHADPTPPWPGLRRALARGDPPVALDRAGPLVRAAEDRLRA